MKIIQINEYFQYILCCIIKLNITINEYKQEIHIL